MKISHGGWIDDDDAKLNLNDCVCVTSTKREEGVSTEQEEKQIHRYGIMDGTAREEEGGY